MPTTLSPERRAELDGALASGRQLTSAQLAYHIGVDRKNAPKIAKAFGLEPEGRYYPWRRIWRCLHNTEGVLLPVHLMALKEKHPESVLLAGVDNLEAALRVPLMSFARMAEALNEDPTH